MLLLCVDTSTGVFADSSSSPTVASQCERLAVAVKTVTPHYPPEAHGASGRVFIRVTLDEKGEVLSTAIIRSSGNVPLDLAAEGAARQSKYAPEYHECKPVGARYLFTVDFHSP